MRKSLLMTAAAVTILGGGAVSALTIAPLGAGTSAFAAPAAIEAVLAPVIAQAATAELDVDDLLKRLPPEVQGSYTSKSYDAATGTTTIEGLTFSFDIPMAKGEAAEDPFGPMMDQMPPPDEAPMTPAPEPAPAPVPEIPKQQSGDGATPVPMQVPYDGATPPVQMIDVAPYPPPQQPPQPPADPSVPPGPQMPAMEMSKVQVTIGRMTAQALDVTAFEKVLTSAGYSDAPVDETFMTLLQNGKLEHVSVTIDGTSVATVEAIDVSNFQMKQFAFKIIEDAERFQAQFKSEDLAPIQMIGAVLDAFKLQRIAITGLKVEEPSMGLLYSFDTYEITGIDRGRIGPARAANFKYDIVEPSLGMKVQTSYVSAVAEGGDISKAIPWMMKAELPPVTETDLIHFGASDVKDLLYVVPGFGTLMLSEARSEPIPFTWLVPSDMRFAMKGVLAPDPNADPEIAKMLTEFGQSSFPLEYRFDWKYDGAQGIADLQHFELNLEGLYGMDFSVKMGGIKVQDFVDPAFFDTAGDRLVFHGISFKLTDRDGLTKTVNLYAKENGMTPEQAREEIKTQLGMMTMGPDGKPDPSMQPIAEALAKFIDMGGILTIAAIPPTPLTAAMMEHLSEGMMPPNQMIETLGIKAEVTPKQ